MIFDTWYTDTVDIYRVVNATASSLTRQTLTMIAQGVPCRRYSSQVNNWNGRQGAATVMSNEKLACAIDTDIQAGDTLYVTRGGALGANNQPEKYIASDPRSFYDPVGGALTGLEHIEVGLTASNIIEGHD